jgi:hypothetical protein
MLAFMDSAQARLVARGPGPLWFRRSLVPVACLYMAEFALGSNGWGGVGSALPSARFFMQGACLFPEAPDVAIEYRLEVWSCERRRFEELDYRHDFPMHADDKENRFHRLASFYRQNRQAMHALEAFVVARQNARVARGENVTRAGMIGGVRIASLRVPFPPPGDHVERYRFRALREFPEEYRKYWYFTPPSRRERWCAGDNP